ncbi:SDR family NAD(P)-dependent oxidoreductase [Rhizobium sp. L1K21]|uniref:SDR family NAD(P)-dependent oxidoreductase n=1 Tax=Rhizobium sp. L1K21 TaxID=2954933 RepID=UPI0020940221|nr:SDR family NAD(P)-dependent oxidoreductase [Rhizobium sp. L1K21]MCO6188284.1 SDR family oxidoreductase [Rhizobium sp. L1K21]
MGMFESLTVLLTGATGGFGKEAARRFYAEGANLVLSDLRDEPLKAFAGEFDSARVATLAGSVDQESVAADQVALAVERFGRLDVAINNAGVANAMKKLPEISAEEARHVIDIDLMGVFYALKHQLPVMEKQFRETGRGGSIVNVASAAGVSGAPGISVYAAAKHGVVGLTKAAALEYVRRGIRVNALCPAFSRTPMVMTMLERDMAATGASMAEVEANLTRGIPARRLGEVSEIVEALIFAASPANGFYTGQTVQVDGGMTAI